MSVVWASSSDSTPRLRTSTCCRCNPKKTKKKSSPVPLSLCSSEEQLFEISSKKHFFFFEMNIFESMKLKNEIATCPAEDQIPDPEKWKILLSLM